jgi:hypothetical protein
MQLLLREFTAASQVVYNWPVMAAESQAENQFSPPPPHFFSTAKQQLQL